MSEMDWKLCAKNRAESLASSIEADMPVFLIGRRWFLLWEAIQNAYGSDEFEKAQESTNRIRDSLDLDN